MTSKSPQPAAPRPLRSFLWSLLGGSVIGGAAVLAGFALGGETVETVATRPRARWVLPGVIAALVGVLAWHELGHVVGGAVVGFRFVLFVAGPSASSVSCRGESPGGSTGISAWWEASRPASPSTTAI